MRRSASAILLISLPAMLSTAQAQNDELSNRNRRPPEYGTYVPGVSPREDNPSDNSRQREPERSYNQDRGGRSRED